MEWLARSVDKVDVGNYSGHGGSDTLIAAWGKRMYVSHWKQYDNRKCEWLPHTDCGGTSQFGGWLICRPLRGNSPQCRALRATLDRAHQTPHR